MPEQRPEDQAYRGHEGYKDLLVLALYLAA